MGVLHFYCVIISKSLPPDSKGQCLIVIQDVVSQTRLYNFLFSHLHYWTLKHLLFDETLPLNPGGVYSQRSNQAVAAEEEIAVRIDDVLSKPLVLP